MKKIILSSSFVIMLAGALIMFAGTGCAHAYHGHSAHTSISMGFDNGYFTFTDFGHGHHGPKFFGHKPHHGPKFHGHGHHWNGHKPPKPAPSFHGHKPHHGHGDRH